MDISSLKLLKSGVERKRFSGSCLEQIADGSMPVWHMELPPVWQYTTVIVYGIVFFLNF
jgi:hypothetical protein